MIGIERGLRHLAWADDRFFVHLATLPAEAFAVSYAPDAWSVGRLATHIVGAAEWYRYCLTGEHWTDLRPAANSDDARVLHHHLMDLDATLIAQAAGDDARVTFADEGGETSAMRSSLLAQAILHSVEHRAQIACALLVNGFDAPVLDDLDLWAYEAWEREQQS